MTQPVVPTPPAPTTLGNCAFCTQPCTANDNNHRQMTQASYAGQGSDGRILVNPGTATVVMHVVCGLPADVDRSAPRAIHRNEPKAQSTLDLEEMKRLGIKPGPGAAEALKAAREKK
jgi:hypothetical protein